MNSFDEEMARAVAIAAHAGQTDKAGRPYIEHPTRVAKAVKEAGAPPYAIAAAWLHDVVEDTPITIRDLVFMGFSTDTASVVHLLTRQEGESHEDAVRRAAEDPMAKIVKRCDVLDNSDPDRLALLDDKTRTRLQRKYVKALILLR